MNQIPRCDWLPGWAVNLHRARSGFLTWSRKIKDHLSWCFIPYNKSFIDQACWVKMAGYWPSSFFACLRSINTQKKKQITNINYEQGGTERMLRR